MYFTTSPTAEFSRKCFRDLLEDGQPHTFKEITDYIMRQAEGGDFDGAFTPGKINIAITQLTRCKNPEYGRIERGVYQKGCIDPVLESPIEFDWYQVLDKAVELQELMSAGFEELQTKRAITPDEKDNFQNQPDRCAQIINRLIDEIAVCCAQAEDRDYVIDNAVRKTHCQSEGMSMSM